MKYFSDFVLQKSRKANFNLMFHTRTYARTHAHTFIHTKTRPTSWSVSVIDLFLYGAVDVFQGSGPPRSPPGIWAPVCQSQAPKTPGGKGEKFTSHTARRSTDMQMAPQDVEAEAITNGGMC